MKTFIITFLNILLFSAPPALSQETPDEYRDCIQYTIEEATQNTTPENNIVTFTFSDKTTRAFHTNADCKKAEEEETTPPPSSGGNSGGNGQVIPTHGGGSND